MEAEDDLDDPERLIQCPYDKRHQIRACRFPYHLVKCRKSHPEVAKSLATCPFNARHLVPQADLGDHISKCRDKGFIEHDIAYCSSGFQRDEVNAVSTWQAPPCDEDWETELLEQPDSPFVWGMTNSGINRKHRDRVIAASSHEPSLCHVGAWCFSSYNNEESSVNSLQHALIICNPTTCNYAVLTMCTYTAEI